MGDEMEGNTRKEENHESVKWLVKTSWRKYVDRVWLSEEGGKNNNHFAKEPFSNAFFCSHGEAFAARRSGGKKPGILRARLFRRHHLFECHFHRPLFSNVQPMRSSILHHHHQKTICHFSPISTVSRAGNFVRNFRDAKNPRLRSDFAWFLTAPLIRSSSGYFPRKQWMRRQKALSAT